MPSADSTVLFRALPTPLKFSAEEKRTLKLFAKQLSIEIAGGRDFTCLITTDKELRTLNSTFLGQDYATDVLSFPALNGSGELGEVAISIDRAYAQALEFGHSTLDEVRVLMLHAVLHLTGLDHERDHGEMARAERKWRAAFNLPGTLIARAKR